jgi:O-antigen ligase
MTIIYAIFAIAASVLAWAYARRGNLLPVCAIFLVVNAAFGNLFWTTKVGPLPLALDRLVLLGLIGMFWFHRRQGRVERSPLIAMDWLYVALIAWFAIRTFSADFTHRDVDGVAPWWHLCVAYLSPAALYVVARGAPKSERSITFVHAVLALFGVYLAGTAVLEIAGQWSLVFPRHIADPEAGLHFGRARGPMGSAIACGMYLCVAGTAAWLWRDRLGRVGQMLIVLAMPLFLVGAYLTYTRCIWMATAIVGMILLAARLPKRLRPVVVGVIILSSMLVATTRWEQLVNLNAGRSATHTRDSTYMRASFAYVSWHMFLDRPLAGCGLGQYTQAKDVYLSDRSTPLVLESIRNEINHNYFLSVLTETGVIGLVLYLALLIAWTRGAYRLSQCEHAPPWARRQGLLMLATVGAYLPVALFQPASHINIVQMLLLFQAGLTAGLAHYARVEPVSIPVVQPQPARGHWFRPMATS